MPRLQFAIKGKPGPKPKGPITATGYVKVLLRLPAEVIEQFDDLAIELQRSRTAVMEASLRKALDIINAEREAERREMAPVLQRARARKMGAGRNK